MRTQVRKIGNSLGNIIPSALVRQLELREGSEIEVKSEDGKIIIEPVKRHRRKFIGEDELLSGNIYTADDNLLPTTHQDNEWVDC